MKMVTIKMAPALMLILFLAGETINAQTTGKNKTNALKNETKKMKVEIWSDVMCPFCYIGKRKFEQALSQFEHKDNVEVEWKSFQLNPDMKTDAKKSTVQYLAETKGWTLEYTKNTIQHVTDMARGVGLQYDFDKAIVANSFDAHRLIQMAKSNGKGDAAEERLFKAYFTEGKNTADHAVLTKIGVEIGLEEQAVKKMLASTDFSEEVKRDLNEADKIGVTGVPFFVIDRKFAVSGAQDPSNFREALSKAWKDHQGTTHVHKDGAACSPDGECK